MNLEDNLYMVWWPKKDGTGKKGTTVIKVDDTYMRLALGFNKFSDELKKIPDGAKFKKPSNWQIRYYCRDPAPDPNLDGFELRSWIEHIRYECLTINDILNLKEGDRIKVLCMDRNLGDTTEELNKYDTLCDLEHFFRNNYAIYIHEKDLQGRIIWSFLYGKGAITESDEFEFHIEYKKNCWYPLKDGKLPDKDGQGFANFGDSAGKHYSEFEGSRRVGWRGPMIMWDKLKNYDKIYWHDEVQKEL